MELEIKEVQVMTLMPGDVLLVRMAEGVTPQQQEAVEKCLANILPNHVNCRICYYDDKVISEFKIIRRKLIRS